MRFLFFIALALIPFLSWTMERDSKIFVAGHNGLVGRAIVRCLETQGYTHIVTKSHRELDLCDQKATLEFFEEERPDYVFLAAAKVGGIWANATSPADFIRNNLQIELNVIDAAYKSGVKKLLFLGSSCIYPRLCPQPIREEYLLSGALEPTNDAYAIAKIAGIMLCKSYNKQYGTEFISCMPTNLYGPYDNFDPETSHVLPALLRKFIEAKEANAPHVTLWGSGKALREFLHVDDLASACLFLMQNYSENETINVGCGEDISIYDLARLIQESVGYEGEIRFDTTKPDGTPRKLLDVSRLQRLGWSPQISLKEGLQSTLEWYLNNRKDP